MIWIQVFSFVPRSLWLWYYLLCTLYSTSHLFFSFVAAIIDLDPNKSLASQIGEEGAKGMKNTHPKCSISLKLHCICTRAWATRDNNKVNKQEGKSLSILPYLQGKSLSILHHQLIAFYSISNLLSKSILMTTTLVSQNNSLLGSFSCLQKHWMQLYTKCNIQCKIECKILCNFVSMIIDNI